MSEKLPSLRLGLDAFPSPMEDRPGLLLRDPYRFSEAVIVVPPLLAHGLQFYDGEHHAEDLSAHLEELISQPVPAEVIAQMTAALSQAGFLEDATFAAQRDARIEAWRQSAERLPVHAGSGYSDSPMHLRERLDQILAQSEPEAGSSGPARSKLILLDDFDDPAPRSPEPDRSPLVGIAAPHVSPEGGIRSYSTAYARLRASRQSDPDPLERVYVLLGTSHYGEPERFGLTRKSYQTPLGALRTETEMVDFLEREGGAAVAMEDYCHSIEHSIEFQAVFLRHVLGAEARILPILCGSFGRCLVERTTPESAEPVRRFLGALSELAAREGSRLCWILGVDLAHIGVRYGDGYPVTAGAGPMSWIEERDRERLARIAEGNRQAFFELAMPDGDDLKWCGLSALYTFLHVMPEARGKLLRYDQWNIDPQSVVSMAAMEFGRG
ncbi:MAG: AmmeMemoRadiSam system protein B [Candidatus Eisenbacteria bacterium]|nr:AmmeMemoRadiSam system protein B [Candidatus Eisenbacteria bacterium]